MRQPADVTGGHSDTIGGVLATDRADLADRLRFLQNAIGAVPGPFDCFLVLRGIRTLAIRMARHSENGQRVAEALAERDDVALVRYPGLRTGRHAHPQADVAGHQMRLSGGMVSFIPTERDGRPAGFLSYTLERRKTFVIDCVEVAPEYRRDGVVRELMHAALSWARAHGLVVVGI